jgi:hypothetical protein
MHLVQILLPLNDNDGHALPRDLFETVSLDLTERFGGVTAYTRAPADGRWREAGRDTSSDEVVVVEVMVETMDEGWWRTYRASLEAQFRQKQIIVRSQIIRVL